MIALRRLNWLAPLALLVAVASFALVQGRLHAKGGVEIVAAAVTSDFVSDPVGAGQWSPATYVVVHGKGLKRPFKRRSFVTFDIQDENRSTLYEGFAFWQSATNTTASLYLPLDGWGNWDEDRRNARSIRLRFGDVTAGATQYVSLPAQQADAGDLRANTKSLESRFLAQNGELEDLILGTLNRPFFMCNGVGDLTVPHATPTTWRYDATPAFRIDLDGVISGNNTFVVPSSGWYYLAASASAEFTGGAGSCSIAILKSGQAVFLDETPVEGGGPNNDEGVLLSSAGIVYLNAGDRLTVSALQYSGGNVRLSALKFFGFRLAAGS